MFVSQISTNSASPSFWQKEGDTREYDTQLSLTYQGSRLARDLDEATGDLRAGDRAPDAPCLDARSGEPVRLFDLLRGTHFTLLVFGDLPVPTLAERFLRHIHVYHFSHPGATTRRNQHTLIDRDGHVKRAYSMTGDALILIRPDGYIGLTAGRWDEQHADQA